MRAEAGGDVADKAASGLSGDELDKFVLLAINSHLKLRVPAEAAPRLAALRVRMWRGLLAMVRSPGAPLAPQHRSAADTAVALLAKSAPAAIAGQNHRGVHRVIHRSKNVYR